MRGSDRGSPGSRQYPRPRYPEVRDGTAPAGACRDRVGTLYSFGPTTLRRAQSCRLNCLKSLERLLPGVFRRGCRVSWRSPPCAPVSCLPSCLPACLPRGAVLPDPFISVAGAGGSSSHRGEPRRSRRQHRHPSRHGRPRRPRRRLPRLRHHLLAVIARFAEATRPAPRPPSDEATRLAVRNAMLGDRHPWPDA